MIPWDTLHEPIAPKLIHHNPTRCIKVKIFRANQVPLWPFRSRVEMFLILLAFSVNNCQRIDSSTVGVSQSSTEYPSKSIPIESSRKRSSESSSIAMSVSPSDSMGHSSRTHSSKIDSSQSDSLHQSVSISVKSSTAVVIQNPSGTVPDSSSIFMEQSSRIVSSTIWCLKIFDRISRKKHFNRFKQKTFV